MLLKSAEDGRAECRSEILPCYGIDAAIEDTSLAPSEDRIRQGQIGSNPCATSPAFGSLDVAVTHPSNVAMIKAFGHGSAMIELGDILAPNSLHLGRMESRRHAPFCIRAGAMRAEQNSTA
jgi:hypothetical protein